MTSTDPNHILTLTDDDASILFAIIERKYFRKPFEGACVQYDGRTYTVIRVYPMEKRIDLAIGEIALPLLLE